MEHLNTTTQHNTVPDLQEVNDSTALADGERKAKTADFLANFSGALDTLRHERVADGIDELAAAGGDVSQVVELIDAGFDERADEFTEQYGENDKYGGMIRSILTSVLSFSEAYDSWFEQHVMTRDDLLDEAGELNTRLQELRERFKNLVVHHEAIYDQVADKEVDTIRSIEKATETKKQLNAAIARRENLSADVDGIGESIYLMRREQSTVDSAGSDYDTKIKQLNDRYDQIKQEDYEYRTNVIPSLELEMRVLSVELFEVGRSAASLAGDEWQELQAEANDLIGQVQSTTGDIARLRGRVDENLAAKFPELPSLLTDDSVMISVIKENPTRSLQLLRRWVPDQLGAEVAKDVIARTKAIEAMGVEAVLDAVKRTDMFDDLLEKVVTDDAAAPYGNAIIESITRQSGIDFPDGYDHLTALKAMGSVLKGRKLLQVELPSDDNRSAPASLSGGRVRAILSSVKGA